MRKSVAIGLVLVASVGLLLVLARVFMRDSGHDPATYTRVYLASLSNKIESFRLDQGRLPRTLGELLEPPHDPEGLGPYVKSAELSDRWNREFYYREVGGSCGFILFSLGADGRVGGSGQNQDLAAVCRDES